MAKFKRESSASYVTYLQCIRKGSTEPSRMIVKATKDYGTWVIDRTYSYKEDWEPITNDTYRTLTEAKKEIRRFEKACQLAPSSPERKRYGLSRARQNRK